VKVSVLASFWMCTRFGLVLRVAWDGDTGEVFRRNGLLSQTHEKSLDWVQGVTGPGGGDLMRPRSEPVSGLARAVDRRGIELSGRCPRRTQRPPPVIGPRPTVMREGPPRILAPAFFHLRAVVEVQLRQGRNERRRLGIWSLPARLAG